MPNQHGGKREGAGRKSSPFSLKHIKIAVAGGELKYILENIPDTRRRAVILLNYIMDNEKAGQDD